MVAGIYCRGENLAFFPPRWFFSTTFVYICRDNAVHIYRWILLHAASCGLLLMKEGCRISSLCSPLICCRMQGKRTDHCKVRIEVFSLFLGEKSCIEFVKPASIMHRSIPAGPSTPPATAGHLPACSVPEVRHLQTSGSRPGICQPRGYSRAFDKRAVSYQNITTHRILLGSYRRESTFFG